ncbi:hypothetical protein BDW02DRAFT_563797, partial [Decorospora gaudefroyi]
MSTPNSNPTKSAPSPLAPPPPTHTTTALQQDPNLWYKLQLFTYDLRNFHSNPPSRDRLNTVTDSYYIRAPYFSATEATRILHTVVVDNNNNNNNLPN